MRIDIRPLSHFDPATLQAIASGYTSRERYRVSRDESDALTTLRLALEPLPEPAIFRFPFDDNDLQRYAVLVPNEFCLGAWAAPNEPANPDPTSGPEQAAIALAEPHEWNSTLWVWEFHVAEAWRGQGVGRRLMAELARRAAAAGLRALVCETQNTNVAAIRFYRAAGFTLDGVDVSYYTNDDTAPGGTVAVFMKRRLS